MRELFPNNPSSLQTFKPSNPQTTLVTQIQIVKNSTRELETIGLGGIR
jgi:hypothetical protein